MVRECCAGMCGREIVGAQARVPVLLLAGRSRTGSYCGEGNALSEDNAPSEGTENASRGEGFNTTMSTRRFLARPSGESLEATG